MNLLGNGKDCSDVSKGIYFRMKDMYCWALIFHELLQMKRHGDIRKENHQW